MRDENIAVLWSIMQMLDEEHIEEALSDALEQLISAVSAESGTIWLKSSDNRHIHSIISSGKTNLAGFSVDADQGVVGQAAEMTEPLVLTDLSADERFPGGKDEITGAEARNVLFMPMQLHRQTIGSIELINKEGTYSETDTALIHSFAGLVAMMLDEREYRYAPDLDKKVIMSLRGITKDYPSGQETVRILKGIDLDIYENEFLVILGESGCGKSTLLNIIGGMDSLTDGTITVDGRDFSHPTEKELVNFRRDDIGFIFQAYNLMPNLTALENVQFIAEICKNPADPMEAIEMVGLASRAGNYPSMMSGGQQQRVSIARAIVKNPRLILADEPTAALDFTTGQEVLELIEDLIAKRSTTVVMVTHNVEIAKMANRVIKVKGGRISSIRTNAWPMKAADLVW